MSASTSPRATATGHLSAGSSSAGNSSVDRAVPTLAAEVARVVAAGNCSGCGACVQLDRGLEMQLDPAGRSRPVPVPVPVQLSTRRPPAGDVAAAFARSCPGRRVDAQEPEGSVRHDLLGPVVAAWEAWATDPDVRHAGSSGGVLTALTTWLASTGQVDQVVGAQADPADPTRTVAVAVTDRAGALVAAGSRYAPVANAAHPAALDPRGAVVGKPCEVSALRALAGDTDAPLLMSFFCAGVPAQTATTDLVRSLGVGDGERVTDLRYRGRGWPGEFTAVTEHQTVRTSYDESWGRHLGPTTQWRCKLCPDGTGESADLVAGDFWHADDRGYPVFADDAGRSVLIARTRRGRELVERAVAAGVLTVGPVDLDAVVAVQPLQAERRRTLAGRLVGNALAGRPVPRYRGFGLLGRAWRSPRDTLRAARGTRARVRRESARARS